MSRDDASVDDRMTVRINWEGLARFLGWYGTIEELKRAKLADFGKPRFQAPRLR